MDSEEEERLVEEDPEESPCKKSHGHKLHDHKHHDHSHHDHSSHDDEIPAFEKARIRMKKQN